MEFVVAVKDIWQLQPSWLHSCKVCDQGRSVGKIMFTRNKKMVSPYPSPPPHQGISYSKMEILRKIGNQGR